MSNLKHSRLPRPVDICLECGAFLVLFALLLRGASAADLTESVHRLKTLVLTADERREAVGMMARDIERRRLAAVERENRAWQAVKTQTDWERFRDRRLLALKKSLSPSFDAVASPVPGNAGPVKPLLGEQVIVTGQFNGDGFVIENVVLESRPGLLVTANLYRPAEPRESSPAVLFAHSHHNPKTQGELQDIGMTWARQGWIVLIMDMLGHGERRQHPFVSEDQYPEEFRLGRQDYYFRYNVGVQLQLVGESLMGWMVSDLIRGVDLLLARPDVDPNRIVLIGSVAGGGDPAAVTAALDTRIAAVAPFNFGGPQPDYAIPENAENEFYYFGVGDWESTRCLRLGGRDGFAHWVIVGSVAPRRLIYSHEFRWDRDRDPVWPRLQKVFGLYGARDHLDVAVGRGVLQGSPPESTHCNNVGVDHRRQLYPHLKRWFNMEPPANEYSQRRRPEELVCLTPQWTERLDPRPVRKLADQLAEQRLAMARSQRETFDAASRKKRLRDDLAHLLGEVTPARDPTPLRSAVERIDAIRCERVLLEVETGVVVPLVLLSSNQSVDRALPTVVMICRSGKQAFVDRRAAEISDLLTGGAAVCIPDLRGTGETSPGGAAGPRSIATTLSSRDQVLGQTVIGSRLRDLRAVLRFLRSREDFTGRLALWGDSLANVNPPTRSEIVPHGVDNENEQGAPSGGLLAMLAALYEDDVQAVYARGTLASYRSILDSQFLYLPHDAIIPGVLAVADVGDVAAALAPTPLRIDNSISGINRPLGFTETIAAFQPAVDSYRRAWAESQLSRNESSAPAAAVEWVLDAIMD